MQLRRLRGTFKRPLARRLMSGEGMFEKAFPVEPHRNAVTLISHRNIAIVFGVGALLLFIGEMVGTTLLIFALIALPVIRALMPTKPQAQSAETSNATLSQAANAPAAPTPLSIGQKVYSAAGPSRWLCSPPFMQNIRLCPASIAQHVAYDASSDHIPA